MAVIRRVTTQVWTIPDKFMANMEDLEANGVFDGNEADEDEDDDEDECEDDGAEE